MGIGANFSYVQTRVQARHGQRPEDAHWRQLEACDSLSAYLQVVRSGPLAPWVKGLASRDDPHELESSLRDAWCDYVRRVASWSPPDWRSAVAWCEPLVLLPAEAPQKGPSALAEWRDQWHRRMPAGDTRDLEGITALEQHVRRWMAGNRRVDESTPSRAESLRRVLERRATAIFRRHSGRPGAIFAHLLLTALDLQRLRGGLLSRRVLARRPA